MRVGEVRGDGLVVSPVAAVMVSKHSRSVAERRWLIGSGFGRVLRRRIGRGLSVVWSTMGGAVGGGRAGGAWWCCGAVVLVVLLFLLLLTLLVMAVMALPD